MYGAFGFKKEANMEVPKFCVLPFPQQGVPKLVAKRQKNDLAVNIEKSPKFIVLQNGQNSEEHFCY